MTAPLLEVRGLRTHFVRRVSPLGALLGRRGVVVPAVDGVDLDLQPDESIGVAGESGCGKTTLGMTVVRLLDPTAGHIRFAGEEIGPLRGRDLRRFRRQAQIIFQDPYASLNPRLTVGRAVEEPLRIHGIDAAERAGRVATALTRAQLPGTADFLRRFPHELSGGQRQRVAIARAIVLEPRFIVADEPVSMLDVSIRAGVIDLLTTLAGSLGLAMLYISHDLSTIRYICQRTAVMYLGRIAEIGPTEEMIQRPLHPYSAALVSAIPEMDVRRRRERVRLHGDIPDPSAARSGCRFRDRCPRAMPRCAEAEPALVEVAAGHAVACYLHHDVAEPPAVPAVVGAARAS
jgi:oligopeptide/dipeptide ABC transporter ATP-binding protein